MNKIYYVLYIVKTLYHLLHVALPRKRGFYCISKSNHGPAAWRPSRRRRHAGELFLLTISFGMRTHQGSFGNRGLHVNGGHLLTSRQRSVMVEKYDNKKKSSLYSPPTTQPSLVLFLDEAKAQVAASTKKYLNNAAMLVWQYHNPTGRNMNNNCAENTYFQLRNPHDFWANSIKVNHFC